MQNESQTESLDARLTRFFGNYEARTNRALVDPPEVDIEATAAAFADCFIEANPNEDSAEEHLAVHPPGGGEAPPL